MKNWIMRISNKVNTYKYGRSKSTALGPYNFLHGMNTSGV